MNQILSHYLDGLFSRDDAIAALMDALNIDAAKAHALIDLAEMTLQFHCDSIA